MVSGLDLEYASCLIAAGWNYSLSPYSKEVVQVEAAREQV